MTATIRHATDDDLAAIQVISDTAYGVYVSVMGREPVPMLADYAAHLAADMVLVALDERADLRGFAVVLDHPDGFWLENIAVDPTMQGHGFGRRLDAIVGIRIEIDRIEAKSKLSQNRASEDFDSVTTEFDRLGKAGLARRMRDLAARQDKMP